MKLNPAKHKPDYFIILCVMLLTLIGLVMLDSASVNIGKVKFNDNYYFVKHQLLYGLLPGIVGFSIALKIYYGFYQKIAVPLFVISIFLLLIIFSPLGVTAGGATRWLALGPISFQPSEFLKITFIIYLAAWLSGDKNRTESFYRGFLPFVTALAVLGAILLKQSSTSMFAIIMTTSGIIYFASGARLSYLLGTIALGIVSIALVSYLTPYRWNRIVSYIKPEANIETTGYHINQARIAIGSGGLFGVGFGQSTTKINYLPEPIGDSIFAVTAEEFGFIGASAIIALIIFFSIRIFMLAKRSTNKFGQLLLVGFGSLFAVQSFVNIASISGLIPLTGMPLPFISYGGTALSIYLIIAGIITNASMYTRIEE